MDNVLIVVDDLEAVKAFFTDLGLELEGETVVEGPSVDRLIGLDGGSSHRRHRGGRMTATGGSSWTSSARRRRRAGPATRR